MDGYTAPTGLLMLGGGQGSLDPSDPMYRQNLMQRQAVLSLLNQGTDSSPARSPTQGLSRMASSLLGAYLMSGGGGSGPGTQAPNLPGAPAAASLASSNPNLAWNPNNPVGTETMGPTTTNTGSGIGNWLTSKFSNFGGAPLNNNPSGPVPVPDPSYMPQGGQPGWQSAAAQPVTQQPLPLPPIPPGGGVRVPDLSGIAQRPGAPYPGVLPNFSSPVYGWG